MPASEKQVRVFISSTFRDMHAERDHLVTVVFPELRERVERLGLEFFDVDLRWGVPARDANGETANSWEYCRQWIDRVEPFFVCILGQRYGWVPEPDQLKAHEDRHRQQDERRSITDMEVRHAVLNTKLNRRSYFYLRATDAPATASEFVDPPPLLSKLEQLKNEVRTCGRPVRDYPCDWTGSGFAGMEEFGHRVLDDLWSGVLRDERYVSKEVWRQALGKDPDTDPLYTDESPPVPEDLAAKIVTRATPPPKEPLDAEREQMDVFAASRLRWFQGRTVELQQLNDFLNSTATDTPHLAVVAAAPGQGKSALLAHLHEQLKSSPDFVITHFVGTTERSASAHPLVERLLGELDRSGITWPAEDRQEGQEPKRDFNSLCLRLAQRLGDYAGERRIVILLDALNQLSDGHDLQWLPHRLGPSVRVIVSCVEDAAAKTHSPEQRVLRVLASRQPVPLRVPLGPLTEADVRTIVVAYLKEYCHELDREHLDTLCAISQARNPLYLLVMLNELRTLGGNDLNAVVPARIASMPQDHADTVSLFRRVLQRLEVFGPEAVRWWCLYLVHGRVGMASHELADLLARKLGADAAATALRIERGLRRYLQRRGPQLDFFHGQLRQAVFAQYGPQAETGTVHHEMADYFTACAKGTDPQKEWETNSVRGFAECVYQLIKAGRHEQAAGLLSNFLFLLHKLRVGLLEGVFEDYDLLRREVSVMKQLEIWAEFFRVKAHLLRRGSAEWPAHKILLQLSVEHVDDSQVTIAAERCLAGSRCDWLWLRRVPRPPHLQKNACLAVLEGHTGFVSGASELADGRLLSFSWDTTLRLWDGHGGACLRVLEGHTKAGMGVLALANGQLLSWSGDDPLRLWDSDSGVCRTILEGHSGWVNGALVLVGGQLLSWSSDATLRIWNSQSGASLAVLEGHTDGVNGALVLADGRLLSWSDDTTLRIWDDQNGDCLAVLQGHTNKVNGALVLADGRLLSWSDDTTLRLWGGQRGGCLAVLEGHPDKVEGALELADGQLLSWARNRGMDNTLWVRNSQNGACIVMLEGHTNWVVGVLKLAYGRLLSWSLDNTLRLWDSHSGACLAVLEGHTGSVNGALVLADGRLLSWSDDTTLRLWDGQNGGCLAVLDGHDNIVMGALELSDGRLLSWSFDETLRLWDVQSGTCLSSSEGHTDKVEGALALADGQLLSWSGVTVPKSTDNTLRLWDVQSGACLALLEGHADAVKGALGLTKGRLLSWSDDTTLRLWDGQSGTCLAVLKGHTYVVKGATVFPDGRLLSWSLDHTLRLWNSNSGACLAVLKGHTGSVNGALVLANGRLLSWSDDTTLRLWDGQSGACRAVLKGHTFAVNGAMALADGQLISWSWDAPLRLWDGHSGACLAVLEGHTDGINGALVLADGRLLSWSDDTTLRIWDSQSGGCLAVLDGHTKSVWGAIELPDGLLLSWDGNATNWEDNALLLWNSQSGVCLAAVAENQVSRLRPEWLYAQMKSQNCGSVAGDLLVVGLARMVNVRHKTMPLIVSAWHTDSDSTARCLLADGTTVVTQANGQVCILKLHHGNRRVSLAEAAEILASQTKQQNESRK